jgi:hypothetical protein
MHSYIYQQIIVSGKPDAMAFSSVVLNSKSVIILLMTTSYVLQKRAGRSRPYCLKRGKLVLMRYNDHSSIMYGM